MKLLSTLLWAAACITAVSAAKDTLECFGKTSPSKAYSASQTYDCVVTHRCDCVGGHVACFPPNALCAQVCECVDEIQAPPPYNTPPRSDSEISNKSNFVKHYSKKWWAAARKIFKQSHRKRMLLEQQEYARQLYARAARVQELLGL